MIVVDASVFNKLFVPEADSELARNMFRQAIQNSVELIAPHILFYEACATALHYGMALSDFYQFLNTQRDAGFRLVEPSFEVLKIAEKIAQTGNPKSGYPSLEDSLYHALAVYEDGVFVTADKKHFLKAKSFGSIELLANLKGQLPNT